MNINLVQTLQGCIDDCDRLLREAELDKERYNRCLSGELLKTYMQASEAAIKNIKKIRKQLYNLQLEQKLEP